jgi:hypothetical protein
MMSKFEPNIKVVVEDGKFVLRDERQTRYGIYNSRTEAAARCEDWLAYYAAPLAAVPTK